MTKLRDYQSQIAFEVLPSSGLERLLLPILPDQAHSCGSRGPADPRHSNSRNLRGYGRGGGEQQFVVVAAVQGEFERDPPFPHPNLRPRNRLRLDFRAHVAFLADVFEVGGKAVTQIDHGRSRSAPAQPLAHGNPRAGSREGRKSSASTAFDPPSRARAAAEPPSSPVT